MPLTFASAKIALCLEVISLSNRR